MSNSDEFNRTAKNPWNQIFMRNDDDGPKNEEYKISSSLKTIWGDSSDDRTTCSHSNTDSNLAQGFLTQTQQPQREYVQFGNNVISIENVQPNPVRAFGTESYHNVVNNGVHPNTLKRRAITSRNGGYNTHFGNENYENQPNSLALSNSSVMSNSSFQSSSSALSPPAPQQSQQLEAFLQKVQVIVKNGFLDQKILSEPISPETFDLIQMLIFYVMEYGRAKSQSSLDEIENTFHKINLIQHEISKCQSHYLEHTRAQQEIVDSFSALDLRQPNFTGQPLTTQYRQTNVRYAWQNVPKPETTNQRFGQRQFDQYAQQPSASASRNYTFLPKAKNVDKRSANRFYSSRDGNFPPN